MSVWRELLGAARDVAPTLAGAAVTALSGGNPMAGAAAAALARKLTGAAPDADLDVVAGQILNDPEKVQQFRVAMRQLELEELRLRTLDVQDARRTLQSSSGAKFVSVLVVVAFAIAVAVVMTTEVPAGSQSVAYLLLGSLGAGFTMVLNFWLGSSLGSKQKDEIMKNYAEAAKRDAAARS